MESETRQNRSRPCAFITGATSGIGRAYATRFARDGYNIVVTGRREEQLGALAAELRERWGVEATVCTAELTDSEQVSELAAYIADHPEIAVLVNNAGFGLAQGFLEGPYEEHEGMLDVHVRVPMRLCRAALPAMLGARCGTIINVSSLASFFPLPEAATYAATKAALRIFSEGLFMSVRHEGIQIQALCPGFVYTDFHRRIGIPDEERRNRGLLRWMDADQVVSISMKRLGRGSVICIPGFLNRLVRSLAGLVPRRLYYRLSGQIRRASDRL